MHLPTSRAPAWVPLWLADKPAIDNARNPTPLVGTLCSAVQKPLPKDRKWTEREDQLPAYDKGTL